MSVAKTMACEKRKRQSVHHQREVKRVYRVIHERNNEKEEDFREYTKIVHGFLTKSATTKLFNSRDVITTRYKGAHEENQQMFPRFRKDIKIKPGDIWDVGSGELSVTEAVEDEFQVRPTTIDIDPAVKPNVVADITRPDQTAHLKRPRLAVGRYDHHNYLA